MSRNPASEPSHRVRFHRASLQRARFRLPRSLPASSQGHEPLRRLVLALLVALAFVAPAQGLDMVLTLDNDFLASNDVDDDLYTFSVELVVHSKHHDFALRENAFTDKEAGMRFDRTDLTVGRERHLPHLGWNLRWEAGVSHVGRGLFGQDLQNAIHRLIDDEEVDLDYIDKSKIYPLMMLEMGNQSHRIGSLTLGPLIRIESAVGFKTQVFAGARGYWQPPRGPRIRLTAGPKLADTSFESLDRHLAEFGLAAEVQLETARGLVATWSLNRYGTRNQHVSFGYRIRSSGGRGDGGGNR